MDKAWVVVALVQILEDTTENLRFLRGQIDAAISGLEELAPQQFSKIRR